MANIMLIYMHIASKMINWALVHACAILRTLLSQLLTRCTSR